MNASLNNKSKQVTELKFSAIRCAIVLLLIILWAVLIPLVYFLSLLIPFYDSQRLAVVFHKGVCFLLGLDIEFVGQCSKNKPVLFVSNHVSYLDIFALGQKVPGFFVAKSEVGKWPVLNKLARLQKTIFIDRKPSKAKQQIIQLRSHFEQGDNLILFPEGTSTNGAEVKSFKSSLFSSVESEKVNVLIQPVSIVYTQYSNAGMNQQQRDSFAWYTDMPFGSHFLRVAGLGKVKVVISFSEPVSFKDYDSRKECAQDCENKVRATFNAAFKGSGSTHN